MRYICLAALLFALPLTADAQQKRSDDRRTDHQRSEPPRSEQRESVQPTSPLPWWERQQTPAWEQKQTPAWELNRIPGWENGNVARAMLDQQRIQSQQRNQPPNVNQHRGRQYAPSVVYVLPAYRYFSESIPTTTQFTVTPPPPTSPITVSAEPPAKSMGALRIDVEPRELLQIFVDGVYVGTPADHGDELELTPGTHRIELRGPGHRTQSFSVEIIDGRSITYRGTLEPNASPAPSAPPAPKSPVAPLAPASAIYVIPGCYLGNVRPTAMTLPATCDLSKLTTVWP